MKSEDEGKILEKLIGQLKAHHSELTQLGKKSPSDAVNTFKLQFINKTLSLAQDVLGKEYLPFEDFLAFNSDDVPSTSDATMILAQYLEAAERYRSDNVAQEYGKYYYIIDGETSTVRSAPPTWSKK